MALIYKVKVNLASLLPIIVKARQHSGNIMAIRLLAIKSNVNLDTLPQYTVTLMPKTVTAR